MPLKQVPSSRCLGSSCGGGQAFAAAPTSSSKVEAFQSWLMWGQQWFPDPSLQLWYVLFMQRTQWQPLAPHIPDSDRGGGILAFLSQESILKVLPRAYCCHPFSKQLIPSIKCLSCILVLASTQLNTFCLLEYDNKRSCHSQKSFYIDTTISNKWPIANQKYIL